MERETHKVTTPVGKVEVELKSWLNGGEKMEMQKVLESESNVEWLLEKIIVAPKIEVIKELHGKDFDFLMNEMNKVAIDSTWDKKKEK